MKGNIMVLSNYIKWSTTQHSLGTIRCMQVYSDYTLPYKDIGIPINTKMDIMFNENYM